MDLIKSPDTINFLEFTSANESPRTRYGLPTDVKYCKKCVISNQRPNSTIEYQHSSSSIKKTIRFDADGICDACKFASRKQNEIDWSERESKLKNLCDKYRKNDGSYDCLVPGSGGKDSFYASHILKTKYGMHPLTVTWAPHIYTEWGWRNFQSWINAGHDNFLMTPNGRVHRLLTRLSTELLFHPFQPFIFGQKSLAPKLAAEFGIPLVFYGENEAEYGNPISDTENARRSESYFTAKKKDDLFIGGVSTTELISDFGLTLNDLKPYLPAEPEVLLSKGIEVHYLGYYLRWHPQECYYYAVENGGFQASPERTTGTYSKYNSIDDRIDDFHYYSTGVKFGIGRATYDASQEIRSGDISRDEGVALVKQFDHEFPKRFALEIFDYLSINEKEFPVANKMFENPIMTPDYFNLLANSFRSPHLWVFDKGTWELRQPIDVN